MGSTPKETTTKTEPWDAAKPILQKYYNKADKLFEAGAPQYYQGSTVADQSKATKDAMAQQEAIARGGQGTAALTNAQNAVANIAGGSANPTQAQDTLSRLQTSTAAGTNPAAGQVANAGNFTNAGAGLQQQQANNLASSKNPVLSNLMATASGANVGKNPYLDQMVATQQGKIADQLKNVTMPGISGQANMLGRSGSNAFATQLNNATSTAAEAMGRAATDMYGAQYNTDIQTQLNANQQVGNFYNSDQQNQISANANVANTSNSQQAQQLAALGLQSDIHNQDVNNGLNNSKLQLDAANSQAGNANAAANTQLGAAGMAGDAYGYGYLPSQQLGQIGAIQDTRAQDVLNADIQKHDFEQTQPIRNIADMINMVNGGGYNNVTTPVYSNTAGQVAGGLGSLLGLLTLCDERTKRTIRQIGFMPVADGSTIPMYEFTYKDDPEQTTWVGPMAQEVEEIIPDAVIEIGGRKHIITDTFVEAA
ncbi:tail fiber domain-containing protein [Neorhizobium sp. T7_12]|uniref:tail fiber domain-containing protein n=1 Tax=Neorhizobium sp. T7_12 TaxID=2093832 RepID=UPI00155ECB83|nr:tail fiber domain-containing protein [Neorhizobium sp. T7_12]